MANRKRRAGASRTRTTPARRPVSAARKAPARRPETKAVGSDSPSRTWVAQHSKSLVVTLSRLPRYVLPVAIVGLMLVGLLAPVALAIAALAIVVLFMVWLAFLSWPVLPPQQRTMRAVAIAVIVLAGVLRLAGWV